MFRPRHFVKTILNDPFLSVPQRFRELQYRDLQRKTRFILLPTFRILFLTLIHLTVIIKRILPFQFSSVNLLNKLSIFFFKKYVSPEAQEILYRHFTTENNLVEFVAKNSGDEKTLDNVKELRPTHYKEMGGHLGHNITLLHDANILGLFIDLGENEEIKNYGGLKKIENPDYSMLKFPDFKPVKPELMSLDFQSSLYIMIFFLVLFLDEKTIENAANSLTLDDSLLKAIAQITGENEFRFWSPFQYTNYLYFPLDAVKNLQIHILLCEYAHHKLSKIAKLEENASN